jgi:hypothetical protein
MKKKFQKTKGGIMQESIRKGILQKSIEADRYVPIEVSGEQRHKIEKSFAGAKEARKNRGVKAVKRTCG